MGKDRLAAFSDGVIAIIITIMVLELHVPHGSDASALAAIAPSFLSYVLSFIYVGIYWNNHHHLLHTVTRVDGLILWANLHLLFWLSIIPVTTAWMGQNLGAPLPTAIYGAALLMPAIAYVLLQRAIIHRHGTQSVLAEALGGDLKGKISPILYHCRNRPGVRQSVDIDRALCAGGCHLARARPAHRTDRWTGVSAMPRARFGLAALSLTILMVAVVTQILTPPAALADDWRTYHNDRYGTTIDYPSVFKPGTPPGNDDGLAFASADGAEFSVFASYNALDFDLAGFQDFVAKNLGADAVITYRAHGDDWFVISGTKGSDRIFYERHLLSHGKEMTEGFVASYPAGLKQKYDPIVARMSKSFRAGRGFQTPEKR